jgi:hypothetical protein
MGKSLGWTRRLVTVLVVTAVAAGVSVAVAGSATASPCEKPDELGNATVATSGSTVGVDGNLSTDPDVHVCAESPWRDTVWGTVDVQDRNPSGFGIQVAPGVRNCTWETNCGSTGDLTTGAEVVPPSTVGVPSPSVDPPADGNGSVGVNAGTGTVACTWDAGRQTCGGVATAGGDPPPINPQPDPVGLATYMVGMVLSAPNYVDFCLDVIPPNITHGAVGCALVVATQYVLSPALMIVDWVL